jgi:hypothetical protein
MSEEENPDKKKLSELKKQRRKEQEERRKEYWLKRKEMENVLGLEGYEQYEKREVVRFMLELENDLIGEDRIDLSDDELDELIDLYFPPLEYKDRD